MFRYRSLSHKNKVELAACVRGVRLKVHTISKLQRIRVKEYSITDKLDSTIKATNLAIDGYQAFEKNNSNLKSLFSNYLNKECTIEIRDEIVEIKNKITSLVQKFKSLKEEHIDKFDIQMKNYLEKYDEYTESVVLSIENREYLQNELLARKGSLYNNITLTYKMKKAINQCLQAGLEVNKAANRINNSRTIEDLYNK